MRGRLVSSMSHTYDNGVRQRRLLGRVISAGSVFATMLLLWQMITLMSSFPPSLLPTPVDVGRALIELWQTGQLIDHIGVSLFRVLSGFLLAALCAIPLGLVLGWYRPIGQVFSPFIQMMRTISPIAWIPLAILWLGIGDKPAIFIIFITSFFPILIATMQARRHIDPAITSAALNFGARGWLLLIKVILPASLPSILIGLRIALGIAWVIIVAAEMVGMRSGLGFLILDARNFLRTDMVIAGMVTIGLVGFGLDGLMSWAERRLRRHQHLPDKLSGWSEALA